MIMFCKMYIPCNCINHAQTIISTSINPAIRFMVSFCLLAVKAKNVVTLMVDSVFSVPGFGPEGVSSTDTNDPLYIGGVPGKFITQVWAGMGWVVVVRG